MINYDSIPQLPARLRDFYLSLVVQTGSGACYSRSAVGPIQAVMWLEYEADHSPPSNTEGNNVWSFTFITLIHTEKKVTKYTYRKI